MRLFKIFIPLCAVLALTFLFYVYAKNKPVPEKLERVIFADGAQPLSAPFYIALEKGFFREAGLEVILQSYHYGKLALEALGEGKADFATVADTPFVKSVLQGRKIFLLATMGKADRYCAILGLKESGINDFRDLRGKTIGLPFGTTADFYLDIQLGLNAMNRADIKTVDMDPREMAEALLSKKVDAVVTWDAERKKILQQYGKGISVVEDEGNNVLYWNLVAGSEYVKANGGQVEKILRGLLKGTAYCRTAERECEETASRYSGISLENVRESWKNWTWELGISQSLLLSCEHQARLMLERDGNRGPSPNFMRYFYLDGLRQIKPDGITLIA